MKKEIFSWAALENCGCRLEKLKTSIKCCQCGAMIEDAGFFGYVPINISPAVYLTQIANKEQLLIRNYQFFHVSCS